ncbi:hypothetical protein [Nocardia sp. CA-290969]|uniref:hypothetical protein n=1 Tax=Nocardia sp. CA-290969 TaxID=3239986 RepID=UPI003D947693
MIGSKELHDLAARKRADDPEFADLVQTLADRREREFDANILAPLIFRRHPDIPDGESWDEQDQQVRDRVTELATIIRVRLEELGWARPARPGRTWDDANEIPEGVPFEDTEYDGVWIRRGDEVTDYSVPDGPVYRVASIGKGPYREVLPA